MPYGLEETHAGWFVIDNTGKRFSSYPLSYPVALRQLRVLWYAYRRSRRPRHGLRHQPGR